ncbi:MAG: class I SAM-dependent methyltransferase [bacterium]
MSKDNSQSSLEDDQLVGESNIMAAEGSRTDESARVCPACRSAAGLRWGHKDDFEILSCLNCKTLYTSQLPGVDNCEDYDTYYHEDNLTAPDFISLRLDEILAEFAAYRQNGRLLDVGFGAGTLLEAARRAGWQSFGVEVSERAVKHVRGMGFEVFAGTLQEAAYPENYFDVVTASEVLEHVRDPPAVLREIARILRPGGLLWLTTPHGRGASAKMLGVKWSTVSPPEHLQLFSRAGSRALLAGVGLRQVRVATEGVNPFELLNGLRGSGAQASPEAHSERGSERVETGYRLNEALMASPSRRLLRKTLNRILNLSRLGDSLKIWAEK